MYRAARYNVWDSHFDELEKASPSDPIMHAPSADIYFDALAWVRDFLKQVRKEA